jgi:two-component system, OmpR family, sensor histidine kinase KdpD
LGLSICKGVIEAHNGRIWAENLADGFAFNFTLPLSWKGEVAPVVEL